MINLSVTFLVTQITHSIQLCYRHNHHTHRCPIVATLLLNRLYSMRAPDEDRVRAVAMDYASHLSFGFRRVMLQDLVTVVTLHQAIGNWKEHFCSKTYRKIACSIKETGCRIPCQYDFVGRDRITSLSLIFYSPEHALPNDIQLLNSLQTLRIEDCTDLGKSLPELPFLNRLELNNSRSLCYDFPSGTMQTLETLIVKGQMNLRNLARWMSASMPALRKVHFLGLEEGVTRFSFFCRETANRIAGNLPIVCADTLREIKVEGDFRFAVVMDFFFYILPKFPT